MRILFFCLLMLSAQAEAHPQSRASGITATEIQNQAQNLLNLFKKLEAHPTKPIFLKAESAIQSLYRALDQAYHYPTKLPAEQRLAFRRKIQLQIAGLEPIWVISQDRILLHPQWAELLLKTSEQLQLKNKIKYYQSLIKLSQQGQSHL